jgi:ornithine cyclodeaminase/alanine dehydrogenase-like protein (mu-crystallin family)
MLILNQQDLETVLSMRDVIAAVERAFRLLGSGKVRAPERLQMDLAGDRGVLLEMPAEFLGDAAALGTKLVTVFPANTAQAIDAVQAVYLLLNANTGETLALMEGRFITAIRTAATSALATKYMASAGPKCLAVFGAGVQARFHIEAMLQVVKVDRILLCSRTAEHAERLAEHTTREYSIPCSVTIPEVAVTESNLICTCTSSPNPLFPGSLLQEGTHVNAVGAFTPSTRELDEDAIRRAWLIVDAASAAGREAGEIHLAIRSGAISADHVRGSLADVLSGTVAGRPDPDQITVFKSCGLAIEDLATAQLAYTAAKGAGIGSELQF